MASSFLKEFPLLRSRVADHPQSRHLFCRSPFARSLRCEHLEDRRLLALLTVTTDQDVVDFNDGQTSLREAIFAANIVPGGDEIVFNFGQPGPKTILLTQGELQITEALTITGPGAEFLTIDAQQQSRIINITATTGNFTFSGMTLTGGKTTGSNLSFEEYAHSGGGIRSLTTGLLNFEGCAVSHNQTEGTFAEGGGIFAVGDIAINQSSISGNSTSGSTGFGGGIFAFGGITLNQSIVSGNNTFGYGGHGGGIHSRSDLTLTNSTVQNNGTSGYRARGGGMISYGKTALNSCLVIENVTQGNHSYGGGIAAHDDVIILGSDILSNSTAGDSGRGGGLSSSGNVTLIDSTISNNITRGDHAGGGGIHAKSVALTNCIVSGNSTSGASSRGGGVSTNGKVSLYGCNVNDNSTTGFGSPGGGIFAFGEATLVESTISGNSTAGGSVGGGIAAEGKVTLTQSTVSENSIIGFIGIGNSFGRGGGIYSRNDVMLIQSSVSDNTVIGDRAEGGGIWSRFTATLVGSTVSGNTISGNNGGGGGVFSYIGVTLEQSTVSRNKATGTRINGGGIYCKDTISLDQSTITNNQTVGLNSTGGGIWSGNGSLDIGGSIIADNTANAGSPDLKFGNGNPVITYSFIGTSAGTTLTEAPLGSPDANGNLIGGPIHGIIDPLLGPLADNGGPTLTHALLPGSPAINAGEPTSVGGVNGTPEFDQRGEPFTRIFGGRIDIGAYEAQSLVVDTLIDENDGDYSPGDFSLREAIALANQIVGANTIEFDPQLASGTILLTMGELAITDSVEVIGLGAELLTIDASGNDPTPELNNGDGSRVFRVDDGNDSTFIEVYLQGLTLTGGDVDSSGGAILNYELQNLSNLTISGNAASEGGGGVHTVLGSMELKQSLVSHNFATEFLSTGGGVNQLRGTKLSVIDSLIHQNSAGRGGGLYSDTAQIVVQNSIISGNTGGGGIHARRGQLSIISSSILDNTTLNNTGSRNGGGVYTILAGVKVEDSLIARNSATSYGGGIYSRLDSIVLINSQFVENVARDGGGISIKGLVANQIQLENILVENNVAQRHGGGISLRLESNNRLIDPGSELLTPENSRLFLADGEPSIRNSTIRNNSAGGNGGGLSLDSFSSFGEELVVSSTLFSNNSAKGGGGGISINSSSNLFEKFTLRNSTISGNRSNSHGGGIYVDDSDIAVAIAHNTITGNTSDNAGDLFGQGGGIFAGTTIELKHSLVTGNHDNSGVAPDVAGIINASYSLIGFGAQFLAPLADNGGPTLTHALLPGSPAINAGDPTLMLGVNGTPEFDQRGAPFTRIAGGRIDIGAYETQPAQGLFDGDFDGDGDVDGRDFLAWQRGYGTVPATKPQGDATGDQDVDGNDLAVWQETYGREQLSAIGSQLLAISPESSAESREPESGSGLLTLGTPLFRKTADNADLMFADLVIDEFKRDQAFEYWQPQQRFDFGDIATRRAADSSISGRALKNPTLANCGSN